MANIAFTTYAVEVDKKTLESLEKRINDMPDTPMFFVQKISYLDNG